MGKMVCRIIENQSDSLKNDNLISYPYEENFYIQGISLFIMYEGPGVIVDLRFLSNFNKIEIIEEFKINKIYDSISIVQ
jgi:hypothetical protein